MTILKLFPFIWKHLIKHWGIHDQRGERTFVFFLLITLYSFLFKGQQQSWHCPGATVADNGGRDSGPRGVHPSATQSSLTLLSLSSGLLPSSPWQNPNLGWHNGPQGPAGHLINYPGTQHWAVSWGGPPHPSSPCAAVGDAKALVTLHVHPWRVCSQTRGRFILIL